MASINDKLRKYKSLFSTTLSTGIGTGTSETITPATVTGLPTDTAITLTIDRVDSSGTATPSKLERIKGIISGGNLIDYVRGVDGTTEQAHSAGAVVEMVWNAADLNDIVDWGLVEHSQLGVHDKTKVVDLTTAQTLTNKTLTSPVFQGTVDGWISANETWTRESDTSFSEPIDATSKYQKGDKIRYKQGGGWKYQYIVGVGAYSGGKTIMTTTGGSDYKFNSGTAITANYYSHQENPIGFPTFFNTTLTYISGGQFNLAPICTFALVGKYCILNINLTNFSVTGSGTAIYSSPFPITNGGSDWYGSVMTGGQPIYFTTTEIGIDKAFGVAWSGGESGIYGMGVLIFRY